MSIFKNLVAVFLLPVCIAMAADQKAADLSNEPALTDQYIQLYLDGNIDALPPLWSPDIHFHDSAMSLDGTDAVLSGLVEVFDDLSNLEFTEENRIVSGHDFLVSGILAFDYAGEAFGRPTKTFHFEVSFAISLQTSNGRITRHVDYVDLQAFDFQLKKQMKHASPADQ